MSTVAGSKKAEVVNGIVIRSKDQMIRQIKFNMFLSEKDDTLVCIKKAQAAAEWNDGRAVMPIFIPTYTAWARIGSKCGLVMQHPDTVVVDGKEQLNGYRDAQGTYYFRSKCGGITPEGQAYVTDRTVDFNVGLYNLQDLLAKAKNKKYGKYFQIRPFTVQDTKTGVIGNPPDDSGMWAAKKLDDSFVLWIDCRCPELIQWRGEMNNREKNAIRICQTFADRNAIAAHPSTPTKRKFSVNQAAIECKMWWNNGQPITWKMLEADKTLEVDSAVVSIEPDNPDVDAAIKEDPTTAAEAEHEGVDAGEKDYGGDKSNDNSDDGLPGLDDQRDELINTLSKMNADHAQAFKKACQSLDIVVGSWKHCRTPELIEIQRLVNIAIK